MSAVMFHNVDHINISGGIFNNAAGDIIHYHNADDQSTIIGKFQNWLKVPDPSLNHVFLRDKHCEGTGKWLLEGETYAAWMTSSNSFMWIHGISGCGKTIICSTIIEDIKTKIRAHPKSIIAYFYFDANNQAKLTVHSLLSSLALQLAVLADKNAVLTEFYNNYKDLSWPTKVDLLDFIKKLLEGLENVYVVIDALDECMELKYLLLILDTLLGWQAPQLHLLASSRQLQEIVDGVASYKYFDITIAMDLVADDISKYIDETFEKDHMLKRWDHNLQEDIKAALMKGANGMIRWVACQIDALHKCITPKELKEVLETLPPTLDKSYDQILQRIDETFAPKVIMLLHWLVFAMRPMELDELAVLVAFKDSGSTFDSQAIPPYTESVLIMCSSLISKISDDTITLAHTSVRDYFLNQPRSIAGIHLDLTNAQLGHTVITRCCLVYLLQFEQETMPESMVQDFKLATYSAEYWAEHYGSSNKDNNFQEQLKKLFDPRSNQFINWVRLHDIDAVLETRNLRRHRNECGSPLYYASMLGYEELVGWLCNMVDAKIKGGFYSTSLHVAAAFGHAGVVQVLLRKGAKAYAVNSHGESAMDIAKAMRHKDVEKMLQRGSLFAMRQGKVHTNEQAESVFHHAVVKGHNRTVKMLLLKDYAIPEQVIYQASYSNHKGIVKMLLDNGVDPNVIGGEYGTALQAASDKRHMAIVKMLLCHGADPNVMGGKYGTALQSASDKRHMEIVKLLLYHGADPNVMGGEYGTALQAASYHGYADVVKSLLMHGADTNIWGGKYATALQAASDRRHIEIVKMLLDHSANPNVTGVGYGTALQTASCHGYTEVVNILLNHGADTNVLGGKYKTALQAASCHGHTEVVKVLLKHGANTNIRGGKHHTSLEAAFNFGHKEIMGMLLEHGATINASEGMLEAASKFGKKEIVKMLLEHGANPNYCGSAALKAASDERHTEIVKVLLEHGANPQVMEYEYSAELQVTSVLRGYTKVVKILLEHGADPNIMGGEYGTALQTASCHGYTGVVNALLKHGADTKVRGDRYGTALQAASIFGYKDMVKVLLKHGADPNSLGGKYGMALHAASYEGYTEIVTMLMKHGADPNSLEGKYGTALQAASFGWHTGTVIKLLEHGADPNVMGGAYGTALQAASIFGHKDMVRVLLEYGADPNVMGGEFGTALQAASFFGHKDIGKMLLKHGADPNVMGGEYGTALQAASYESCTDMMEMLLKHGANPNVMGGKYGTALQAASLGQHTETVHMLLEHNANPNIMGGRYGTALQAASILGHTYMVKILLEHGADPNVMGGEYDTALQAASVLGHKDVLRLLLVHGADPNAVRKGRKI